MTRMPLDSDWAQCPARSRQAEQRMNNDWPSSYWLACRFQTRGVEAMVKPHTCVPVPVVRSSGFCGQVADDREDGFAGH